MKILFVLYQFPLPSEIFILNRITGLIERGHDVEVISQIPNNKEAPPPDFVKFDLLKKTTYLKDNPRQPRRRVDIIQACFGPLGLFALKLRDMGAIEGELSTSFHGYDLGRFLKKHGESVYRDLFERGDLFLPVSEKFRELLVKLGCPPAKTHVHRSAIDLAKFPFSEHARKAGEPFRLLSAGRLVEKKGFEYGVQAVKQLLDSGHRVTYSVIGEGLHRIDLAALIMKLGLEGQVKLLGWKSQEEVVQAMKEADALLAPSVTAADGDQEGIPNILKEAMATGLPVISTRHSAIPELIPNQVSGLLVEERNATQLSDAVRALIADEGLGRRLAAKARTGIEELYDIRKLSAEAEARYQALLV